MKPAAVISSIFCSPELRNLCYWIFYFSVRYIAVDLVSYSFGNSLICNGPKSPSMVAMQQAIVNVVIYIVSCPVAWVSVTLIYALAKYLRERFALWRSQESSSDRWIWLRQLNLWREKTHHAHFPIDVLSMIYHWVVTLNRMTIFSIVYIPVIVHDFDQTDDAAWPHCSLVHTVILYQCKKCRDGNRLELVRSSLYRRMSQRIRSWPLQKKFFDGPNSRFSRLTPYFHGWQSGGLIFIYVMDRKQGLGRPISLDIYNMRSNRLIRFDTSFLPNTWTPFYFFRDHVQNEKEKTIYIRLLYCTHAVGVAFIVGQALIEFPIDYSNRIPVILSHQEISFPLPWRRIGQPILQRSSRRTGIIIMLQNPDHEGITWRCHCVYDADDCLLKTGSDYQIFVEGDQAWAACASRYLAQFPGKTSPPFACVLTPAQAIVTYPRLPFWSTNFQPPSLKELCLKALLKAQRDHITEMDGRQWQRTTGVKMDQHFV